MLQVLSKTNLDTTLFIGNDEPTYRIIGINIELFKKGYHCDGIGATATTFMADACCNNVEGLRTRFTKTEVPNRKNSNYSNRSVRTYFKRKVVNDNTGIELIISNIKYHYNVDFSIRISPSLQDQQKLLEGDILSRYSRHIKTTEEMVILPDIYTTMNVDTDDFKPVQEKIDEAQLHLDTIVARTKEFEDNFKIMYPLLVLRSFANVSNRTGANISLSEFDKLSRQSNIIENVSIPSIPARKQFIELCDIFKNNNVIPELKANNFEFRNDHGDLVVSFFGIEMIRERNFKHFQFFDHPGINFCADYLDKSRTLDIIEAKLSKEIITRI